MHDPALAAAQAAREDRLLDDEINRLLGVMLSDADAVGPEARSKLKGLLKFYAKKPHPFRSCVADNMKRFGPGRTEAVCAVLKDIIRGTTKWRGHPNLDHGTPGVQASNTVDPDACPIQFSDAERRAILTSLTEEDFNMLEQVIVNGV